MLHNGFVNVKLEHFWKRSEPPLIGLDIGSHSAKAVLLKQQDDHYVVVGASQVPIPAGAVVEHEIKDFEAVGNALKPLFVRMGKKSRFVAAAVAGSSVITKIVYVEGGGSSSDLEAQVQIEADHLIPFPLEEVSLDFEVIGKNEASSEQVDILLSACRTEHVDSRVAALKTAGFTPKIIDIEAYALGRALPGMINSIPPDIAQQVVAMVDVGANMMLFSVVKDGETIYSKEQPFGGDIFNQGICAYYGMDPESAEKAKIAGELPPNYDFEVLAPFQTQLVQQVRRNMQIFSTSSGIQQIDVIFLSGGSAILPGMADLLREELSVHSELANPFAGMEVAPEIDAEKLKGSAHQYAIACGLALRSSAWRT